MELQLWAVGQAAASPPHRIAGWGASAQVPATHLSSQSQSLEQDAPFGCGQKP
jgi:hypothetical protein